VCCTKCRHDSAMTTRRAVTDPVKCSECGSEVDPLAVFPGGLCLPCWEPIGEAEAKTMTAEKLTRMWGGK
jgi:hypothetical protein